MQTRQLKWAHRDMTSSWRWFPKNSYTDLNKILQDDRYRQPIHLRKFWFGGGGVQILPFPTDFHGRPYNILALVCTCVINITIVTKIKISEQSWESKLDISVARQMSFSALTLLVGWQEGHPACKKLSGEVLAWLSVWSEVQMICIWSSWCHCHPSSRSSKIQNGLSFWCWLTQVVLQKGR